MENTHIHNTEASKQQKVSVIIPCYNISKYLDRCMQTIIHQTYTNIEIILVNDGSTDDTQKKCEEYAKNDARIIVLNKKNGGLSDARNYGLNYSTGFFLFFIDPDDCIELNAIELLVNEMNSHNLDIALFNFIKVHPDKTKEEVKVYNFDKCCLLDKEIVMNDVFNDKLPSQIWKFFFRKEIHKNIFYPVGRVYAEDVAILHLLLHRAYRIGFLPYLLYNYFVNENTLTTSYRPFKWISLYLSFKERLQFAKKNYPNHSTQLEFNTLNLARLALDNYIIRKESCDEPYINEITQFIRSYTWNTIGHNLHFKNKIMIYFYNKSPLLYKKTIRFIHFIYYKFHSRKF